MFVQLKSLMSPLQDLQNVYFKMIISFILFLVGLAILK